MAFELNKFQFAKRLIEKQVSIQKLREKVTNHQNLLLAFASNCPSGFDLVCSENIVDLLMEAGISIYEKETIELSRMSEPPSVGDKKRKVVIILTFMRSGSTFLGEIFNNHPDRSV